MSSREKAIKLLRYLYDFMPPISKLTFDKTLDYINGKISLNTLHKYSLKSWKEGMKTGDPLSFACAALSRRGINKSVEWIPAWIKVYEEF
jgi:hypothetical protein